MFSDIDQKIISISGYYLSSPYGSGNVLGQPLGVKSIGFIEIKSDSGETGVGESYAGVYMPELMSPTVDILKHMIIGRSVGDNSIIDDISQIPFIGRNGIIRSIASAVDIALWDLRGKILDKPVYKLLSEKYRGEVDTYASNGSAALSPEEIAEDVINILTKGFRAYKMRVGYQDWDTDIERVTAARIELKTNKLMVDAIMGTLRPTWSASTAIERSRDLEAYDLQWLEEPIYPEDINSLAAVREASNIPIAAGEAYSGWGEYQELLLKNAVDVLQFDATHSGGISECIKLAKEAENRTLRSAVHVWGSAVAISANANITFACPEIEILEIPMVPLEITEKMWQESPKIENGKLKSSDYPGLGIVLTDEMKEQYAPVTGSGYRLPVKNK